MQIERHQIELRYQSLRVVDPAREARLAASLLAHGQRQPVLVFAEEPGRFVLVDGHRRLRALTALRVDVLSAMDLECAEADALLRAWQLGMSRRPEAIEEAWLVRELMDTHGLSQHALAAQMGRSTSWISRRTAILDVLPAAVQEHLRRGAVCAHAAQRVLVPLARANTDHCARLMESVARHKLTSRQLDQWWRAWRAADATERERLVSDPALYLRVVAKVGRAVSLPPETPEGRAAALLQAVAGACFKARTQLVRLLADHPELRAHAAVAHAAGHARTAWAALSTCTEGFDGSRDQGRDHRAA
jgi:ParB/RepB/Spo0J family partition protein